MIALIGEGDSTVDIVVGRTRRILSLLHVLINLSPLPRMLMDDFALSMVSDVLVLVVPDDARALMSEAGLSTRFGQGKIGPDLSQTCDPGMRGDLSCILQVVYMSNVDPTGFASDRWSSWKVPLLAGPNNRSMFVPSYCACVTYRNMV